MRSLFRKTSNRTRKSQKPFEYGSLEARQLLAVTTSFDAASGQLAIELADNNDIAVVDVVGGQVQVNGADVAAIGAVNSLDIDGDSTQANQQVALNGAFIGVNSLQSVSVDNVNQLTVVGDYVITGDLNVTLVGTEGGVGDGATGRLTVGGTTDIDARSNFILLNNADNDFQGTVDLTTGGFQQDAQIADANDLVIERAIVSGDFVVNAGGAVTDVAGATIEVTRDGDFTADSVELGDNDGDTTNFFRARFEATGHVSLQEDSNTVFVGSTNVGSLYVESEGGIHDGRTTSINVQGLAELNGAARIRLGEHGADIFNAGSVQLQSNGHINLQEDSSIELVGENFGRNLDLRALGDLTDGDDATINIQFSTGFSADNVAIGDSATDEFNTGTLYFWTLGDLSVSEDSDTILIDSRNFADRSFLASTGTISDTADAFISINRLARFEAENVTLGDAATDTFNAGSISYDVSGRFFVSENSNTNIAGNNTTGTSVINSQGNITNAEEATLASAGSQAFFGQNITLGGQQDDSLNFGTLTVNTPENGAATIFEDSSTAIVGNSSVGTLRLISEGAITDGGAASLNVSGAATLSGSAITIGDTDDDVFNAASLNINSEGNVRVYEDSGTFLAGNNTANSFTVRSEGNLLDAEDATLNINFLLDATADFINLGTEAATDLLSFASLTVNSTGNVSLNVDRSFNFVGDSTAERLTLESTGNITDANDASIQAELSAFFTGIDITIGDSDDDCFEVASGDFGTDASGVADVTDGGC